MVLDFGKWSYLGLTAIEEMQEAHATYTVHFSKTALHVEVPEGSIARHWLNDLGVRLADPRSLLGSADPKAFLARIGHE